MQNSVTKVDKASAQSRAIVDQPEVELLKLVPSIVRVNSASITTFGAPNRLCLSENPIANRDCLLFWRYR